MREKSVVANTKIRLHSTVAKLSENSVQKSLLTWRTVTPIHLTSFQISFWKLYCYNKNNTSTFTIRNTAIQKCSKT